jgi:hypothetical protein
MSPIAPSSDDDASPPESVARPTLAQVREFSDVQVLDFLDREMVFSQSDPSMRAAFLSQHVGGRALLRKCYKDENFLRAVLPIHLVMDIATVVCALYTTAGMTTILSSSKYLCSL